MQLLVNIILGFFKYVALFVIGIFLLGFINNALESCLILPEIVKKQKRMAKPRQQRTYGAWKTGIKIQSNDGSTKTFNAQNVTKQYLKAI